MAQPHAAQLQQPSNLGFLELGSQFRIHDFDGELRGHFVLGRGDKLAGSLQPMLSLLNIKQCLLAFKCDTSSPLINIHPLKRKFWSQPVTLLYKGRAHAVLVYLAFDSIKKQHVTFFTPQITFPTLHSCLFLASNPNKYK